MNTIAERIKFAMKAKNKKQVDIVKDTGISKGAFSSYLSGQYNPKADKMELIADSLDVDLRWLYGQNVPMEHTSQNDNALQYVFYNNSCSEYLLDDLDDIYIAMMTQYAALIPRFYVLVNRAGNAMHILPLFLKEDSSQFYECPSDFFYSDRHTIFTRDFESIHMVLTTATIYYYGIDTATYEPKVTMLSYSQTGIITEFVEPGKGLIDFQKVYKQLMDHGFAGWVVLESFGRANQDDQEVVATLLDRFQYIK